LAARRGQGDGVAEKKVRAIEIAPDEVDVVALFLALQTQWRLHAMTGAATGLIYEAVPPTASMSGIETTPQLFADLRTMESAALKEWARKR
jgi:pyrroloquinoline quinone (PQQ) biosynthesis protein C